MNLRICKHLNFPVPKNRKTPWAGGARCTQTPPAQGVFRPLFRPLFTRTKKTKKGIDNTRPYMILSLTVDGRKNRCIPCIYWAAAIFAVVADYSNLFLSLTFFLNRSHFTFGYELIVRPETTGFMKIIRGLFPLV